MRKTATLASLLLVAAFATACSEKAQEETSEAGSAIGNDMENAGDSTAMAASNAWNATSNAASNTGDAIEDGVN